MRFPGTKQVSPSPALPPIPFSPAHPSYYTMLMHTLLIGEERGNTIVFIAVLSAKCAQSILSDSMALSVVLPGHGWLSARGGCEGRKTLERVNEEQLCSQCSAS